MKWNQYIVEELGVLLFAFFYLTVSEAFLISELVYFLMLFFFIFSLFELLPSKNARTFFYLVCLLLFFLNWLHPIFLLLLTYFFTRDYSSWGLLALLVLWLLQVVDPFYYIFTLLVVYLAQKSMALEKQTDTTYETLNLLQEEKIKTKNQREALFQAQQTDLDVAILEERNRISHQLHDAVGHSLARSIMQIEALKTLPHSQKMLAPLNQLQESLQVGMNDIRSTIHEIHQESLNIKTSIRKLQEELPSLHIQYVETIRSSFAYSFKTDLLAIIREAVHNTVKHSNATTIHVVLHEYPGILKLVIKDNGTNIDVEAPIQDGIGQTMIRQVAQKYQGSTIIHYKNGYTTQIILNKEHLDTVTLRKGDTQ